MPICLRRPMCSYLDFNNLISSICIIYLIICCCYIVLVYKMSITFSIPFSSSKTLFNVSVNSFWYVPVWHILMAIFVLVPWIYTCIGHHTKQSIAPSNRSLFWPHFYQPTRTHCIERMYQFSKRKGYTFSQLPRKKQTSVCQ